VEVLFSSFVRPSEYEKGNGRQSVMKKEVFEKRFNLDFDRDFEGVAQTDSCLGSPFLLSLVRYQFGYFLPHFDKTKIFLLAPN